jgi:hypothetical protein
MHPAKTHQVNPADITIGAFVAEDFRIARVFEKYGSTSAVAATFPCGRQPGTGIDPAAIL